MREKRATLDLRVQRRMNVKMKHPFINEDVFRAFVMRPGCVTCIGIFKGGAQVPNIFSRLHIWDAFTQVLNIQFLHHILELADYSTVNSTL